MKLLFRQRFFTWFDSYNIYYLDDDMSIDMVDFDSLDIAFRVEGQFAWGHAFHVFDKDDNLLGKLEQEHFTLLSQYNIEVGGEYVGSVEREFSLFSPRYNLEFRGWQVEGDMFGWDYRIIDENDNTVASISKELFRLTDTYVIDVPDARDSLYALMVVLAIDADHCRK